VTCSRRRTGPLAALAAALLPFAAGAVGDAPYVATAAGPDRFTLVEDGRATRLWVDDDDWAGVVRAVGDLRADVERVTGVAPEIWSSDTSRSERLVIVGTLGRSALIDRLVAEGRIDAASIAGQWESYFLETVSDPLPGVDEALVIVGSDKRGTIYGVYDLSEQIGVSPWYWWADVTPDPADALYVLDGRYERGEPAVRYRGIFLNDERPDLDYWVRFTYGERPSPISDTATIANFNSDFYARIFEVILRMKGNYLWPAMWNNAFAEDDPENARLADEYGIVMGTSHQEPMLRAQKEWDWHRREELGTWNFAEHPEALTEFWRGAVIERGGYENLYTIGLRGEDDTAMIHGEAENIRLLQEIVAVQRDMLRDELGVDPATVPQVWTLYKEVQGYYENGLRVPNDVTLLWAEDNWGNVRRLPTPEERERAGGAGVYYHFDYHGGPRSYQWINTNPIAKIWDQMSLAKQYGADEVWIVNVGHFKGYELPMEYFLELAWDTDRWTNDNVREYMALWAAREFGEAIAVEAAEILAGYTRFNGRRKPELLRPDTYSLTEYQEFERVVADYEALAARVEALHDRLPEHKRSAFYQLVLFNAKASAQLNALYLAAGRNALYARQGRAATNAMAERTRELFDADQALMAYFNEMLEGGKWNHFMDQPKIGYVSWRDPPEDSLQAIDLVELELPAEAALGVAVDGDASAWPAWPLPAGPGNVLLSAGPGTEPVLPLFDAFNRQRHGIEVFNRGRETFEIAVETSEPWIRVIDDRGEAVAALGGFVDDQLRLPIAIDWENARAGESTGTVTIAGAGSVVTVGVRAFAPEGIDRDSLEGFVESDGLVSIEAEHYSAMNPAGDARWIRIEDYGHTLSGMRADAPVDVAGLTPGRDAPSLEYRMHRFTSGPAEVELTVAPTLNFVPGRGLRVAVSFDDGEAEVLTLVPEGYDAANGNRDWEASVRNNYRLVTSEHDLTEAGEHRLKLWMIDPAVVVQKIVVRDLDRARPETYLGPPESYRH
jgi:hypothetical protein